MWSTALFLAISLAQSATPVGTSPRSGRHALLVGIQAYPEHTGWPALSGPRADVEAIRSALVQRAAFDPADVTVLLDEQATRDSILAAFESMIEASATGDLLLFYYAGHGSQLPDDATSHTGQDDEPDGLDETIVPFDATSPGEVARDIRDDDFAALIARANERTDNVLLLFDSCSSGTIVRGAGAGTRFVPLESRGLAGARGGRVGQAEAGSGMYDDEQLEYVSLSACRAREEAFEVKLADGRTHGLFTFCLLQELYRPLEGLTYEDLVRRVGVRVSNLRPGQTPTLEGSSRRKLLFGGEVAAREASFELRRDPRGWVLAGGRVTGLTGGSRLDVYGWDTTLPGGDSALGSVVIDELAPTSSLVHWTAEPDPRELAPAYRAFLVERGPEGARLEVAVEGGAEHGALELESALLATGMIRLTTSNECAILLRVTGESGAARWTGLGAAGTALPLGARVGNAGEVQRLAEDCATLARAHQVRRELVSPESRLLRIETFVERVGKGGVSLGGVPADDAGLGRASVGETIATRLVNHSALPIYAYLLVISPDGAIQLVQQPQTLDDFVAPGGEIRSPSMTVTVAPGTEAFYRAERDCLRWIATTEFTDLRSLEQSPVHLHSRTRGQRVAREHAAAVIPLDEWVTATAEIEVLPAAGE